MNDYVFREVTLTDIEQIVTHRHEMFTEMGVYTPEVVETATQAYRVWLPEMLRNGGYRGWFAEDQSGHVVGGAGIWLYDGMPGPGNISGQGAHIVNVYVDHAHRQRGLASRLTQIIVDWCREQGFEKVTLHASEAGRSVYERLGFSADNHMVLKL